MTKKEFLRSVGKDKDDILQQMLDLLKAEDIKYCLIGGLAVNVYAEPVVSLDLDIVVVSEAIKDLLEAAKKIFKIEKFPHSYNLSSKKSDLRIQIQIDSRYQTFIKRALLKEVMGYKMMVASLEDVFQGKIWAYSDDERRKSKRQKDLADIYRLIEAHPQLKEKLPASIKRNF